VLTAEGLDGYDIIFADLGVSSMQIDDPARGFTYKHDGPLDMRMDERLKRTAADLLATLTADELSAALAELADEPDHERLARRIVQYREHLPIRRTSQLTQLILEVKGLSRRHWREQVAAERDMPGADGGPVPSSERLLHPAARTFQALRIMVNDELGSLRQLLRAAPYCLRPGGRLGIITFHSGEDRLVRQAFHEGVEAGQYSAAPDEPIRPSPKERYANPRSGPAKFRWARRALLSP
jgi:16S rRNA (cytosine1402-N4)-methyltransferase